MTTSYSSPLISALSKSVLYRSYQEAFERATGLSVDLHGPDGAASVRREIPSSFCALMKSCRSACQNCAALKIETEREFDQPQTKKCFAGLCETVLPLSVEGKIIGFLRTGRVLLGEPNKSRFQEVTREITSLLPTCDLQPYEEAFYKSRVLSAEQYEAMIQLLSIFSNDLAACYKRLMLQNSGQAASPIIRAKIIIEDCFRSELTLCDIAKRVGVSSAHFSMLFKKVTGLNFVEHLSRLRIEESKSLLQIPNYRISEAAYKAGFQSVSQFNRTFRRLCGVSPRAYRTAFSSSVPTTSSRAGM